MTKLLTKKEAAAKLGVCPNTIYNWKKLGLINPIKVGGRYYYTEEMLNELIKES